MTLGINILLLLTGALGSFTCSWMALPIYMGPTALRATRDTQSQMLKPVFYVTILVAQLGIEPQTFALPGLRV